MLQAPRDFISILPEFEPIFHELRLNARSVWDHPLIKVWRKLDDRENGLLDTTLANGRHLRLHVKRYLTARGFSLPADDEVRGWRALSVEKIPTARIAAWGKMIDRRSFVISEDLAGFTPADKLIANGTPFQTIGGALADMTARLHQSGLHHRDLYLCHFLVKMNADFVDIRLIDTARVKRLPALFTRQRWIVKDLAQFWFSTLSIGITDAERVAWLKRYAESRQLPSTARLQKSIEQKVARIARHDINLRKQQPNRNVSIP